MEIRISVRVCAHSIRGDATNSAVGQHKAHVCEATSRFNLDVWDAGVGFDEQIGGVKLESSAIDRKLEVVKNDYAKQELQDINKEAKREPNIDPNTTDGEEILILPDKTHFTVLPDLRIVLESCGGVEQRVMYLRQCRLAGVRTWADPSLSGIDTWCDKELHHGSCAHLTLWVLCL